MTSDSLLGTPTGGDSHKIFKFLLDRHMLSLRQKELGIIDESIISYLKPEHQGCNEINQTQIKNLASRHGLTSKEQLKLVEDLQKLVGGNPYLY